MEAIIASSSALASRNNWPSAQIFSRHHDRTKAWSSGDGSSRTIAAATSRLGPTSRVASNRAATALAPPKLVT